IEAIAFGAVVPERGKPNLAREVVFEAGLPPSIEAPTVSSYCITGLRTPTLIAHAIPRGRISAGIARGAGWPRGAPPSTSRAPLRRADPRPRDGRAHGDHAQEMGDRP